MKISKRQKNETSTSLKHKKRKKRSPSTSSTSSSSSGTSSSSNSSYSSNSSNSSSSSSSSSNSSSSNEQSKKNRKRVVGQKFKGAVKSKLKKKALKVKEDEDEEKEDACADVPIHLMDKAKAMAPMTKEQWEKQQSAVKKVYDTSTGRQRLIKGDGEVVEEIVSKDRHKTINKLATKGDGDYFQRNLSSGSFK